MSNDLISAMASEVGMPRDQYWNVIMKTVMPSATCTEDVLSYLAVAHQYKLNPLTNEIHAFKKKDGGIQSVVGVDGWIALAERHAQYDGMDFEEIMENKKVVAVKYLAFRKDRSHPSVAIEHMEECYRDTAPWKRWPIRMLHNKAIIQALRRAFSFSGIMDNDEYERMVEAEYADVTSEIVSDKTQDKAKVLKEKITEAKVKAKNKTAKKSASEGVASAPPSANQEVAPDEKPLEEGLDFDSMSIQEVQKWCESNLVDDSTAGALDTIRKAKDWAGLRQFAKYLESEQ